jgi:predicted nuclease of restriction endonuclease-like (RecB) superfamily
MRSFAAAWNSEEILQRLVGQIPWGQNITLITKFKGSKEREWYALKIIESEWSRPALVHQIESGLIRARMDVLVSV